MECLVPEESVERSVYLVPMVQVPLPEMVALAVPAGIQRLRVRPAVLVVLVVQVESRETVWPVMVAPAAQVVLDSVEVTEIS